MYANDRYWASSTVAGNLAPVQTRTPPDAVSYGSNYGSADAGEAWTNNVAPDGTPPGPDAGSYGSADAGEAWANNVAPDGTAPGPDGNTYGSADAGEAWTNGESPTGQDIGGADDVTPDDDPDGTPHNQGGTHAGTPGGSQHQEGTGTPFTKTINPHEGNPDNGLFPSMWRDIKTTGHVLYGGMESLASIRATPNGRLSPAIPPPDYSASDWLAVLNTASLLTLPLDAAGIATGIAARTAATRAAEAAIARGAGREEAIQAGQKALDAEIANASKTPGRTHPTPPSNPRPIRSARNPNPGSVPATVDSATAGYMRPQELASAQRLIEDPRFDGRIFQGVAPPDPGHDWIDDLGRTYDQMGDGTRAQYLNIGKFEDAILSHLRKSNDFTVIDLTGYSDEQISAIREFVDSVPLPQQGKIIRIGF